MKIEIVDKDNIVVYLNKFIVRFIDFSNVEDSLKLILKKLRDNYDININGYLNVSIYIDDDYGMVVNFNVDEVDYFDYLDNCISMNINKIYKKFMYEFEDINDYIKEYFYYNNKFYTDKLDIRCSDFYKVIYDNQIDKIKRENQKIII